MHATVLRGAVRALTEQRDQALAERDRARATAVALEQELDLRSQLALADESDERAIVDAAVRRWFDDGQVIVDALDKLCHDYAKTHGLLPISEDDLEWNE